MTQLSTGTYNINEQVVNTSPIELCWRLVYGGTQAHNLFESIGLTETTDLLECYTTEQECWDRCVELNIVTASLTGFEIDMGTMSLPEFEIDMGTMSLPEFGS
jgi:hypothetical protein